MEGNQMSVAYEERVFNRRAGLGGVGRMGCTLVTGFLGSGKTTLLRHLLDHRGDLRLAVLVNEFADSDVDSLLLDSARLNAAFDLPPTVSLTHGCACCEVRGPFRESLRRIVDSRHNFDCLLIETSGLATPDMFLGELEEVGIHLDINVAVVDAESLDRVMEIDVVKQQLQRVDLVILNKCDMATLGQISDAEDILENLTGGAKVVRSQFCRVPLELVIDCGKMEASKESKEDTSVLPVLSHESLPKLSFRGVVYDNASVGISSLVNIDKSPMLDKKWTPKDSQPGQSHVEPFLFSTFERGVPLSLSLFQSTVLPMMNSTIQLLRAKGILWFAEDRENRYVLQWSGAKRVEIVSGGPWDSSPRSRLVVIGTNGYELDSIIMKLERSAYHPVELSTNIGCCEEFIKSFTEKVAMDGRFKEPCLEKNPIITFGLKGSPLRGVREAQLNGALMRVVNGRGNIFLTMSASTQDQNLQLLADGDSNPREIWNEIRTAASLVVSKLCRNFCPCRSDLTAAHVH